MAPGKTVPVPLPKEQSRIWDNCVIVPSCRKAASGRGPRQALPVAKCLGVGGSLFWPQRSPLSPQAGPEQPRACLLCFPVFLVPLLLGPVRGDHALSEAGPPPLLLGHSPQTASEVVAMASFVSSVREVLCGKQENSRRGGGVGSRGTGLLQSMTQWEEGPWLSGAALPAPHPHPPPPAFTHPSLPLWDRRKPNALCAGPGASFPV